MLAVEHHLMAVNHIPDRDLALGVDQHRRASPGLVRGLELPAGGPCAERSDREALMSQRLDQVGSWGSCGAVGCALGCLLFPWCHVGGFGQGSRL